MFPSLFQFKLTVPKMGNVSDLLMVLSKEANVPKDKVSTTLSHFAFTLVEWDLDLFIIMNHFRLCNESLG